MTPSPSPPAMPAMPAELLPCPFCGATKLREGQGSCYFIECEQCFDEFGTTVCAEGDARHDAVAMWNRRPALSRQEQPPTAVDAKVEATENGNSGAISGANSKGSSGDAPNSPSPGAVREIVEGLRWLKNPDVPLDQRALWMRLDPAITALSTLSRQSGRGGEAGVDARYERTAYCLMEMMKAYERRVRSECKTQAELDAEPWRCQEFLCAEDALKKGWRSYSASPTKSEVARGE